MRALTTLAFLIAVAVPAKADRPVTDDERVRLQRAVEAERCTADGMEYDDEDRAFEVNATCEGRKFELKFNSEFRLIRKELDD